MPSMEANYRWALVTAIAPVAWGANYYVTSQFLPPGIPLYGAAIRALPAGLLLLAVCRQRPRGSWWWKSLVLGTLNVAAFFVLIYLAAQLLPVSIASNLMAASPLAIMLFARALLAERPHVLALAGAGLGIAGVCLMLLAGSAPVRAPGVLAAIAAMTMSSLGYVLAKRWNPDAGVLASTAWQLIAGGLILIPIAAALEGPPPAISAAAILGFGYVTTIATAVAFAAWFTGLQRLPAATVGLIGLLNPVTGVLLGTVIAGETLTVRQLAGLALVLTGVLLGQRITATWLISVRERGSSGTTWLRLDCMLTRLEADAFAGAGWIVGKEVHKAEAQRAEQQVQTQCRLANWVKRRVRGVGG